MTVRVTLGSLGRLGDGELPAELFEWPDYEALVAEVERLYAEALASEPQPPSAWTIVSPPLWAVNLSRWAASMALRADGSASWTADLPQWATGLYPAIVDWETAKLEAAKVGQMSWDEWTRSGKALGMACAQIAADNNNATPATTFLDTFGRSVKRDVAAVADVSLNVLSWLPWVVGGLAIVVGGVFIYKARR